MVRQFIKRFYGLKRVYCEKEGSFVDWLINYIKYGASFRDYFMYKFFEILQPEKKTYITYKKHKKIQKVNNNPDYVKYFST